MAECTICKDFTNYAGGKCYTCYTKAKTGIPFSKPYSPSEGEEFIMDFLNEFGIKYETQYKIEGLKGDTARYRLADFYLPKYKVYIEFFGQWNNEENKLRYKYKKDVYRKNNIPCIYFYPENLGILPFVFDKRLQEVLRQAGLTKLLRKYQFWKLYESEIMRLVYIGIFVSALFLIDYKVNPENNLFIIGFLILAIIYQIYKLTIACINIFKKNRYPLLQYS